MTPSRLWQLLLSALALVSSCHVQHNANAAETMDPPQKLQWLYYQNSCPDAEKYVRDQVEFYWKQDRTLALKLIRLLYSDCFITLCIIQNAALLGLPMEMIDKVKEVLEQHFPGDVSCTGIINLAAKDAVVLVCNMVRSFSLLGVKKDRLGCSTNN